MYTKHLLILEENSAGNEEVKNNIINSIILQLIVTISTSSVTSANSFISSTVKYLNYKYYAQN